MKTILVMSSYISYEMGGIENMAYNIFKSFNKSNAAFGICRESDKNLKSNHITERKSKYNSIYYLKVFKDYFQLSNHKRIDMSYCLTWKEGIIAYFLKKLKGINYKVFIHGDEIIFHNNIIDKIKLFVFKKVIKNAVSVISNSDNTNSIMSGYGLPRGKVVHPGINFDGTRNSNSIISRKSNNELTFFSVGRLVERKGFQFVIEALEELDFKKDIKYYIAGDGPYKTKLEDLIYTLGLSSRVKLLGRIDDHQKYEYLNKSDLFLMPSKSLTEQKSIEGFGIVFIEANSFGKFVIGGNSGGIPDAIKHGETGLLCEPSKQGVLEAINEFIEKYHSKIEFEDSCKKWAMEHDWSNILKQY